MSKVEIKKINSGELKEINGDFLVIKSEVLPASNGSNYLMLTLSDGKQEIVAKMWNYASNVKPEPNEVIAIEGVPSEWKGTISITVKEIIPSEMSPLEFKKHGPNTAEECCVKILHKLLDVESESIKKLCIAMIKDNKDLFLSAPAAVGKHHAYEGGLAQHTLEVMVSAVSEVKVSNEIARLNLNLDLVICGSILHDIGKTRCYFMNGEVPEMTTVGKFKDHIVEGVLMLNEKAVELGIDRTQEWFMKLEHIILSHHGKLEWGSPVAPCFPEAYIIHQADMNSSRIVSMQESINEINGEWGTKRDWMFGSYLYAGGKSN